MFRGSRFRKDFFRSALTNSANSTLASRLVLSLPSGLRLLGSAVLALVSFTPSLLKMDTEHFKQVVPSRDSYSLSPRSMLISLPRH